ncbi:Ras guanine nucleotide exchange factor [Pelomyxa schiedti]|nr:Ras guanine nucleotide exchange factor [Pelomyxa schiedti]
MASSAPPSNGVEHPVVGRCVAMYSYKARKEKQLSFRKGDVITLFNVNHKWWTGELNGKIGKVPSNFVRRSEVGGAEPKTPDALHSRSPSNSPATSPSIYPLSPSFTTKSPAESLPPLTLSCKIPSTTLTPHVQQKVEATAAHAPLSTARAPQPVESLPRYPQCTAIYSYAAKSEAELSFTRRETIYVINKDGQWWYGATTNGKFGEFPSNYVSLKDSLRKVVSPQRTRSYTIDTRFPRIDQSMSASFTSPSSPISPAIHLRSRDAESIGSRNVPLLDPSLMDYNQKDCNTLMKWQAQAGTSAFSNSEGIPPPSSTDIPPPPSVDIPPPPPVIEMDTYPFLEPDVPSNIRYTGTTPQSTPIMRPLSPSPLPLSPVSPSPLSPSLKPISPSLPQTNDDFGPPSSPPPSATPSPSQIQPALQTLSGATLVKLVEKLTGPPRPGSTDFMLDFLLTYRSFTDPPTLLRLLILRYNTPPGLIEEDSIKKMVSFVLTKWVTNHFYDFAEDKTLLDTLMDFVEHTMGAQGEGAQLKMFIRKGQSQGHRLSLTPANAPKSILPAGRIETILDVHPLEAARQITLLEWEGFRNIRPRECFGLAWQKKEAAIKSPNICRFITRFNKVGKWVLASVLEGDTPKQRERVIRHFISIAKECKDLGNFNGMMEITAALGNSAITRLKKTWTSQLLEKYKEFECLMEKNFKTLRDLTVNRSPCLPYIGIFLSDLTFIEDGNPNTLPDSPALINWLKMTMTAKIIKEIQQHQSVPFAVLPVISIQAFISDIETKPGISEQDAYNRSLEIEPRASH